MVRSLAVAALVAQAAAQLSARDIGIANTARPRAGSPVAGPHHAAAFAGMNRHLENTDVNTEPCANFDHDDLNQVAELLLELKDPRLNEIYMSKDDNRKFSTLSEHRELWASEAKRAAQFPDEHGPGTRNYDTTRNGKCAELVMWWVHHLSQASRSKLSSSDFTLPLMPTEHDANGDDAYNKRLSCSSCHLTVERGEINLDKANYHSEGHGFGDIKKQEDKGFCEIEDETGLPSVWYESELDVGNRRKRCDGDYVPACRTCEGTGGYLWGDQQDEFSALPCRVIGTPEEVPEAVRIRPIWPEGYTNQVTYTLINSFESGGLFPGGGPCAPHILLNQTNNVWYDGVNDSRGPTMRRDAPADNQVSWTRPDFNFYIKIENIFCICITPTDESGELPIGPLKYNWAEGSTYVGREEVELEFVNRTAIVDHWMKGPHHHWMDVETGEMVRGWQPWQGLNLYFDWNPTIPDPINFKVDESCYKGFLNQNISCISGPPDEDDLTRFRDLNIH